MPVWMPIALQRPLQLVAVARAHRVDVIDVARVRASPAGVSTPEPPAARSYEPAAAAARLGPALQVAQLDPEDGALNAFHPVVEALAARGDTCCSWPQSRSIRIVRRRARRCW